MGTQVMGTTEPPIMGGMKLGSMQIDSTHGTNGVVCSLRGAATIDHNQMPRFWKRLTETVNYAARFALNLTFDARELSDVNPRTKAVLMKLGNFAERTQVEVRFVYSRQNPSQRDTLRAMATASRKARFVTVGAM